MKRLIKKIASVSMVITLAFSMNVYNTYAYPSSGENYSDSNGNYNGWVNIDGRQYYFNDGTLASVTGIDVSAYQSDIDWDQVKSDGVSFAIIRAGYGDDYSYQDDSYAEYNMSECERVGIPYGMYIFSYAQSQDQVASEVAHIERVIGNHNPKIGIWYDMEDNNAYANCGAADLNIFSNMFLGAIQSKYGNAGLYASKYWLSNILTDSSLRQYNIWVAQYYDTCTYNGNYSIWQYTSDGSVNGIAGRVDMNAMLISPDKFTSTYVPANSDDSGDTPATPITNTTKYNVGDHVTYHRIYSSSNDETPGNHPYFTDGTIIAVYDNTAHPYLLDGYAGFLDNGAIDGYYADSSDTTADTTSTPSYSEPQTSGYSIGDYVTYSSIHASSTSEDSLTPYVTEGTITYIKDGATNPYLINGGTGWVNASDITSGGSYSSDMTSSASDISEGCTVRFSGTTDYNGTPITAWHNDEGYVVSGLSGDRAVLSYNGEIFAAVNVSDLY